jgi:hypothetical protein
MAPYSPRSKTPGATRAPKSLKGKGQPPAAASGKKKKKDGAHPPSAHDGRAHDLIARLLADPSFQSAYGVRRGASVRTGAVSGALGARGRPFTHPAVAGQVARDRGSNGWTPRRFKDALKSHPGAQLVDWVGRDRVALTAHGLEEVERGVEKG